MLTTVPSIWATPGPQVISPSSVTGGSCNKNVFSPSVTLWSGRCTGGLAGLVQSSCHLCSTLGLSHDLGQPGPRGLGHWLWLRAVLILLSGPSTELGLSLGAITGTMAPGRGLPVGISAGPLPWSAVCFYQEQCQPWG